MDIAVRLIHSASLWLGLVLAGLVGCSTEDEHRRTPQAPALTVQNYPGSVLWYNPGNEEQRAPGRSVSIGREAFSLPEYRVAYNAAQSHLVSAPVGQGHCLSGDLPLVLAPRDSDELPPGEPLSRLSVAFWAHWQDTDTPQPLLSLGESTSPALQVNLRDNRLEVEQHGQHGQLSSITSERLEPDQWHHLVVTLNRIGPPEAEQGLALHVNAEQQGTSQALSLNLDQLQFRFHEPTRSDSSTCYSDIVVLLDPIASSTVDDLYALSGRSLERANVSNENGRIPN